MNLLDMENLDENNKNAKPPKMPMFKNKSLIQTL